MAQLTAQEVANLFLTAQEVANLVIGKDVNNDVAFTRFIEALNGKPLEFIVDVSRAVPEPKNDSDSAPDGLQLSAIAYLGMQAAKLIADEVLQANMDNQFLVAQKCRQVFFRPWTVSFMEREVERRIEEAPNKGVVYHIIGLTFMGEAADKLIEVYLAEAE